MYSTFQDNLNQMETSGNATAHPVPDFSPEREKTPLWHGPKNVFTVRTSNSCQNERSQIDIIDQKTPSTVGIHLDSSSSPVYSTNSVQADNSDRSIDSQMYSTDGVYDSCLHVQQDAPHDISRSQSQSKCHPAVHQHNDPVVVRALAGPVNEARIFDLKPDKRSREPRPIVSLYDPTSPISVCPRFPRKWNGPVRRKLDDVIYHVKTPQMRTTKAHSNGSGCSYSSGNSATLFHRAKLKGRSQ